MSPVVFCVEKMDSGTWGDQRWPVSELNIIGEPQALQPHKASCAPIQLRSGQHMRERKPPEARKEPLERVGEGLGPSSHMQAVFPKWKILYDTGLGHWEGIMCFVVLFVPEQIRTHTHTHTHAHTHTHTHTPQCRKGLYHIQIYIHVCVCACVCVCMPKQSKMHNV
jgi:hypothetical protein